jgi:hypothetical protein
MSWIRVLCAFTAAALIGCGGDKAKPVSNSDGTAPVVETTISEEDLAKHNRAVAHMARHEIKLAEPLLSELAEKHPNVEPIVVDRAVAAMHRVKGGQEGVAFFEDAVKRFPDSDRARYGLAYLYSLGGKLKEAADTLKPVAHKVEAGTLKDAHVACQYGFILRDNSRDDEALKWFKKACELDPFFFSATYAAWANSNRTARNTPESKELNRLQKRLESHPYGMVSAAKHKLMGPLLDVVPLENRLAAAKPAPKPEGPIFLDPVPLLTTTEWGAAKPSEKASLTVCDIDGDGLLDLFFADANVTVGGKSVPNAIMLQSEGKKFRLFADHPMASTNNVTAVLWGDVNNDGLTDAFLCRKDGNEQWMQTAPKKWEKTDEAKSAVGPKTLCNGGVMFDADFDGDLDVFLVYDSGPNELLQNDGNGKFTAKGKELGVAGTERGSKQAFVSHRRGMRIPDLVVLNEDSAVRVFSPDLRAGYQEQDIRQTVYRGALIPRVARPSPGSEPAKTIEISRYPNENDNWKSARIELGDLSGDGTLTRLESIDGVISIPSSEDASVRSTALHAPKSTAWTLANFDAKRGPSLVCLPADGSPPVALHPGPGRYDYFSLSFIGDKDNKKYAHKSNRSGIGVKVSMRLGSHWACQYPLSQSSGPGQSLQPIAIGSRGAGNADFLFIDWSNGDFQCEPSPPIGKTVAIKELDRTPEDSCPLLFVWNGSKYEFITDFLGVGGVDYLVRPGEYYTPTDPTENVLLPEGVQPMDGAIKLKVVEAAEEITFLDRAALVCYDLPPGWRMTLDERHTSLPPTVTHEPRFFKETIAPIRAANESGVDCTESLRSADFKPAEAPKPDRIFKARYERPHQLTLEFAKPIDETCRNPTLLFDAWVSYPDAQGVMNASQANVGFSAPKLEAADSTGAWKVVYPEFGFPAGMQRQSSLPLVGLPKGCTRLRLTHEIESHWDRIALIDVLPCPTAKRIELKTETAALEFVGSPKYRRDRPEDPYSYDYDECNPFWPSRVPTGKYTRYGDCRELIATGDDASATIGPGEEVHLEFKTPPPPQSGWTRRYVLESRGWCRGMRIYTRNGMSVEPMPHTNLPKEPRDRLHEKFNTRVVD